MWKSFSKNIERNFKSAAHKIEKTGNKGYDKLAHGTWDKSDHWHSEYPDEQEIYDLTLRRDNPKKGEEGPANTGRFKFSFQEGIHHTASGVVQYRAMGILLLQTREWMTCRDVNSDHQKDTLFQTQDELEEPCTGNGCWQVPPGFFDFRVSPKQGNDLPTFEIEMMIPDYGKHQKTGEKVPVQGPKQLFEIYLPPRK